MAGSNLALTVFFLIVAVVQLARCQAELQCSSLDVGNNEEPISGKYRHFIQPYIYVYTQPATNYYCGRNLSGLIYAISNAQIFLWQMITAHEL